MIEGCRQFFGALFTAAALNTQITALNTRFANVVGWVTVPLLDTTGIGVQNMWAKGFVDLARPGVGYSIGMTDESGTDLLVEGKSRMTVPVYIDATCASTADKETAVRHIGIYEAAIRRVIESMESKSLSTVLGVSVSPDVQLAQVVPHVRLQPVSLGTQAAGQQLGVRMRFDIVIDDLRS